MGISRRAFMGLGAAGVGSLAFGSANNAADVPDMQRSPAASAGEAAKISWRIRQSHWVTGTGFAQLVSLLSKHRAVVDEVCLMESSGMSFFPAIEFWDRAADAMLGRIEALRRAGIPHVGINVLVTLGHAGEMAPPAVPLLLPKMVGHDGKESQATPCPTRPEFLAYTRSKYAAMAGIRPDFIWVDDDVRMQNHPGVVWGCFCPVCLQLFGKQVQREFTREQLVATLNDPQGGGMRRAWVARNASVIEKLYATIGDAIHDVDPNIKTGMMTIGMVFSNYYGSAYDRWFSALRATKARPGHGFYWDTLIGSSMGTGGSGARMDLFPKAAEIGRQTEAYPAAATDRQYEYETWPDGQLAKSPQTAINEFAVALISGNCNGMALDTLGWGAPYSEYEILFDRLGRARSYLDSILQHAKGLPGAGMWCAWSPHIMASRAVHDEEAWLTVSSIPDTPYDQNLALTLGSLGIPLTARPDQPCAVLTGRIAEAFSDEQLRSILTRGVLLDTVALRVLSARGLGELTGVRIAASFPIRIAAGMTTARLTSDQINGPFAGALHNCSAFTPPPFDMADTLAPLTDGVRNLAQLEEPMGRLGVDAGEDKGPCVTAFENMLGGRVVVVGYSPWWFLQSASMRHQMLEIADWISRARILVRIVEPVALTPYVRVNADASKGVILLFNTGLEIVETATVHIRVSQNTPIRLVSAEKGPAMQRVGGAANWGLRIRHIAAWSTVGLLLG
jgi:hypothetical protein